MKSISEFLREHKEYQERKRIERIEKRADEIFQITEHDGRLWFTYETFLYCPCSVMGDDAIGALVALRKSYIDRKTKK
jgi:hypothetical protein